MALMYDMETVNQAMRATTALVGDDITARERWILNQFATMKPIEAEPVVHAYWVKVYTGYYCSACGTFKKRNKHERCRCGAIMDGRPENVQTY